MLQDHPLEKPDQQEQSKKFENHNPVNNSRNELNKPLEDRNILKSKPALGLKNDVPNLEKPHSSNKQTHKWTLPSSNTANDTKTHWLKKKKILKTKCIQFKCICCEHTTKPNHPSQQIDEPTKQRIIMKVLNPNKD